MEGTNSNFSDIRRYPRQKVTLAEKKRNNYEWGKDTLDYIISDVSIDDDTRSEMRMLYRASEGQFSKSDYSHVLNPFNYVGKKEKLYTKYPARLRNYPLLKPVKNIMLAEYDDRPSRAQVVTSGPFIESEYADLVNKTVDAWMKQEFYNELNAMGGIDTGVETQEQPPIKEVLSELKIRFDERLAIRGQRALEYINYKLEINDEFMDLFNDWLVVGRMMTHTDIRNGEIHYERLNPIECYYPESGNKRYLEDRNYFLHVRRLTPHQILDYYQDEINDSPDKEEILSWLDTYVKGYDDLGSTSRVVAGKFSEDLDSEHFNDIQDYGIPVYHGSWISWKREGILTYLNEINEEVQVPVDETYKLEKSKGDISIEWVWVTESWEGLRIDDHWHLRIRPCLVQREGKLNFNGRITRGPSNEITSFIKDGLPYQFTTNMLFWRAEQVVNKSKDKVMWFPMSLVPSKEGWDMDKFMYYITALGFAPFDDSKPNAVGKLQGMKEVDMSLFDSAVSIYELIDRVKLQFWDAVGMNRQRYGDVMASDGKGVTEQAIFRSSMVTAEMFRQMDRFQERDYNGLLDVSKYAWAAGKKAKFRNGKGDEVMLDIMGTDWVHADMNAFVANNNKEAKKLDDLKNLSLSMLQNEGKHSVIAEVIDSDNFSELKAIIAAADAEKQANLQQQMQIQQESNEVAKQKLQQDSADKRYVADRQYQGLTDSARIRNEDSGEAEDNSAEVDKQLKERELALKERAQTHNENIDNKELHQKDKHHADDIALKNKQINKASKNSTK